MVVNLKNSMNDFSYRLERVEERMSELDNIEKLPRMQLREPKRKKIRMRC